MRLTKTGLRSKTVGNDEHGPAYPEPPKACSVCGIGRDWCIRDNCPGRNPISPRESVEEVHRRISTQHEKYRALGDTLKPYRCPICNGDRNRFMTCEYPGCPDGCDQPGRFELFDAQPPRTGCAIASLVSVVLMVALLGALLFACVRPAHALDHGFDPYDPTNKWFSQLLRHDNMPKSCCGKADGYVADTYKRNPDGSYDVTITDGDEITFPDGTKRTGLPNGSVVHVPENQINPPVETMGNPTGHSWLFVSILRDMNNNVGPGPSVCFAPLPEGS